MRAPPALAVLAVLIPGALVAIAPSTGAQTLFVEDFESGLGAWIGKNGGSHTGTVVPDPLRPGNNVLSFTSLKGAGDIFGTEVPIAQGETHVLTFEYLGLPNLGGVPGDLGGSIGFAEDTPGKHRWLAATVFCCCIEDDPLIDDGQWHTYSIPFDVFASGVPGQCNEFSAIPPTNNTIRLMLLDFNQSGGIAGDICFDNLQLERVVYPTYCTAGTSANGCQALISAAGFPSATGFSGFLLIAKTVEGAKDGIFYYGVNGRQATPWGTGYQCVVPPVRRGGLLQGIGTSLACDGYFSQDLNARWTAKPQHNPGTGAVVQAQLWFRDPWNTATNKTTTLSDAIEFTVGP